MQFIHKFYQIFVLLSVAALAASGCAGAPQKTSSAVAKPEKPAVAAETLSEPRWVSEGCEAFWSDGAKDRLCAVGVAAGPNGLSSLRNSAERRARNDIARELGPEIEAMVEHYANSRHGHQEFGNPPDLERVRNLGKLITETSLRASATTSIWVPAKNRMHVLISIDAESLRRTVSNMPQLSEKLREELHKSAEKGFKTIKQAEEKS